MGTLAEEAVDLLKFTELRMKAYALMQEAAKLHHLPTHYQAQAFAAAYLCGDRLHRVIGEPTDKDAEAIATDLSVMARRALDPLIESIGRYAAENLPSINKRSFSEVVGRALESADEELREAGADLRDSRADTIAEKRREFIRA